MELAIFVFEDLTNTEKCEKGRGLLEKVKVSPEIAKALDKMNKDDWSKQFNLIGHCKGYSGDGKLCGNIYAEDLQVLDKLQPLEFARCLIVGYEPTQ